MRWDKTYYVAMGTNLYYCSKLYLSGSVHSLGIDTLELNLTILITIITNSTAIFVLIFVLILLCHVVIACYPHSHYVVQACGRTEYSTFSEHSVLACAVDSLF